MRRYKRASNGLISLSAHKPISPLAHKPISLLILSLVLCLWSANLQAATLEPKIGARPLGMSAFAAVADDINAICWNPAGLSLLQNQEATAAFAPLYGSGISQSYVAYAYPTGRWGTAGINLAYLGYGDMDWRDDSGKDMGSFSRKDYSVYASYGVRLIESLSLGLSMGTTSVTMGSAGDSATGLGFDLGVLYTIASRASLGLYLENIGGVSASDREIARQKIRTGAAFSVLNRPSMGLVAALDIEEQQGKLDTLYSGVEWSVFSPSSFFVKRKIQERQATLLRYEGIADYAEGLPEQTAKASLCVRAGIRKRLAVDESMGLSGGICVKYLVLPDTANLRMEHAFSWTPYLGAVNRFSLGVELFRLDLGRAKAEPDIEEQEEVEPSEEPPETDEDAEETEEAAEDEIQEEPEQEEQTQEDPRY